MLYVPIIVPEIVLAVALLIIFMNLGLSLGMGSILIGHCTFCIPYAVVTIKGRISGDGDTLEEASMDLGANRIQTFFRVTLPSIMPGVIDVYKRQGYVLEQFQLVRLRMQPLGL